MKVKTSLLAIVLILSVAFVSYAAESNPEPGYTGTIADTSTVQSLAAASLYKTDAQGRTTQAREAWVVVEAAAINFTLDGTAPSAAAGTNVGINLPVNGYVTLKGFAAISKFKCINRVDSNGAIAKYVVFF